MKKVYVVETKVCDYEDFVWDEVTPKVEAIFETYELARIYVNQYLQENEDEGYKVEKYDEDTWEVGPFILISISKFRVYQSEEELNK